MGRWVADYRLGYPSVTMTHLVCEMLRTGVPLRRGEVASETHRWWANEGWYRPEPRRKAKRVRAE